MTPTKGWAAVSIHAGPIEVTGRSSIQAGAQVNMGDYLTLNIKPEVAAQWLPVITAIAEESK
jgi:ribosomal 50S subunit-recycling heat shock protein